MRYVCVWWGGWSAGESEGAVVGRRLHSIEGFVRGVCVCVCVCVCVVWEAWSPAELAEAFVGRGLHPLEGIVRGICVCLARLGI